MKINLSEKEGKLMFEVNKGKSDLPGKQVLNINTLSHLLCRVWDAFMEGEELEVENES